MYTAPPMRRLNPAVTAPLENSDGIEGGDADP